VSRGDRIFLVIQRISSSLVLVIAIAVGVMLVDQWIKMREYERESRGDRAKFGGELERTLPYSGQEIETSDGSLIAIFQDDGDPGERIERGGITISDPGSGRQIELAPEGAGVVQFELIFDQGDHGNAVGYLATIATAEQYRQGRQDLVVGAFPALTRTVAARDIRYSDLPRIRGDGSVGLLMWPEEGEAYLVAIRLSDGAIIERAKVKLPTLKQATLSQGTGAGFFAPGRRGVPVEAPIATFGFVE
jgi:hypothetical protein